MYGAKYQGETTMHTIDTKNQFIAMRAEGKSFTTICEKLNIAKSTCSEWEKMFNAQIAELKQQELETLYETFFMTKEARIKKLGETLNRINETLSNADLSKLPLDKLLDYKLKFTEALKEEIPEANGKGYVTAIFSGEDKLSDDPVCQQHKDYLSKKVT
jgi:hypothetical protein